MKPIIRICPPSRYDKAPYGSICYVNGEDKIEGYIQIGRSEDHPDWILIGDFLWGVFADQVEDDEFIEDCLNQYYDSLS
mgnify:CR=1 FL=1